MALYDYLFDQIADARVRDWPLMRDPLPTVLVILVYLALVLKVVPCVMLTRRAFKLKPLLAIYNLAMVLTCVLVLREYHRGGIRLSTFLTCTDFDYSDAPDAMRVLRVTYITMFVKIVELVETVFFLLRKKDSQVTFLHVYHHVSTLFLSWVGAKYVGGGMVTFAYILNYGVHVLMYSYYFLALGGPRVQRALQPVKKSLTMVQMVQFVLMLGQCVTSVLFRCPIPTVIIVLYCPNIALNLYLFAKFYRKSYLTKQQKQQIHQRSKSQKAEL